jgi:hypothetical protein
MAGLEADGRLAAFAMSDTGGLVYHGGRAPAASRAKTHRRRSHESYLRDIKADFGTCLFRDVMVELLSRRDGTFPLNTSYRMRQLLALLLSVMSGAALAQTTGTVSPGGAPADSAKTDVPPGGCMPIGLTASGEFVFPIQCKELIEQHRGKASEQKPAEEKAAAKQSEGVAPVNSQPAIKPVDTVPLPKRVERERAISSDDCSHYRSYDPASGTYTGYDGRRRSCR